MGINKLRQTTRKNERKKEIYKKKRLRVWLRFKEDPNGGFSVRDQRRYVGVGVGERGRRGAWEKAKGVEIEGEEERFRRLLI